MVYISEHIWDFNLTEALAGISVQRREHALRFKHELGQRLCVLAYQLLKQGLREEYGITENPVFEYSEHGKPSIVGHPEIFFNLSHCKEAVVCALGERPVGIDIETIREYKESLARYTMNTDELALIEAADCPDEAFIRLWTMKEATLKLTGTGIASNLKTAISSEYQYTTVVNPERRYIYTYVQRVQRG